MTNDRCERTNLIGDPSRQAEIEAMRRDLLALMRRTGDPFVEAFARRDRRDLIPAILERLDEEYSQGSRRKQEPGE